LGGFGVGVGLGGFGVGVGLGFGVGVAVCLGVAVGVGLCLGVGLGLGGVGLCLGVGLGLEWWEGWLESALASKLAKPRVNPIATSNVAQNLEIRGTICFRLEAENRFVIIYVNESYGKRPSPKAGSDPVPRQFRYNYYELTGYSRILYVPDG
jgi:hypothetical protein